MPRSQRVEGLDRTDLVDVLEALYAFDRSEDEWLFQSLVAFAAVCRGDHDHAAFFYDASNVEALKFGRRFRIGKDDPELAGQWSTFEHLVNPDFVRATFRSMLVGSGRTTARRYVAPVLAERERHGHGDFFFLNAVDPSGIGVVLAFNSRRPDFALKPAEMALLRRIATHLSAAYRCRRRLASTDVAPALVRQTTSIGTEAILDEHGHILHAEGIARTRAAQQELRDALVGIDAARSAAGQKRGAAAIEHWHPLAAARWTLVDSFEESGRRYILARENQADAAGLAIFSDRERQVVVHAAFGMTTKEIGYALGISDTTVRVLIARAAHRLGVRTRGELLAHPMLRGLQSAPVPDLLDQTTAASR